MAKMYKTHLLLLLVLLTVFFRNDDGELMGLGYDIVRTACKTMNKKCEHSVYYDYNLAYNDQKTSPGWCRA